MGMIIKGGVNYCIVRIEKLFEDRTGYRGYGGKEILMDVSDPGEQAKHVRIYGEVTQVPLRISKQPMLDWEPHGFPSYGPESVSYKFKTLQDIEQVVEVGDRVYFHYNSLMQRAYTPEGPITRFDRQNYLGEGSDGSLLFRINYGNILCTVKVDGEIVPVGGHVLCEADKESWDDIMVPVYYDKGRKLPKPRDKWLLRKTAPETRPLRAYIRHKGLPLRGDDDMGLEVGDYVIYKPNADWPVKIEGVEYYPIKYKHILAKIG